MREIGRALGIHLAFTNRTTKTVIYKHFAFRPVSSFVKWITFMAQIVHKSDFFMTAGTRIYTV